MQDTGAWWEAVLITTEVASAMTTATAATDRPARSTRPPWLVTETRTARPTTAAAWMGFCEQRLCRESPLYLQPTQRPVDRSTQE